MSWGELRLWEDEEQKILQCLKESLLRLIQEKVKYKLFTGDEKFISGKLRPILKGVKKKLNIECTLHFEASSFENEDDPDPFGHPDIRFSFCDRYQGQYDYDIECKLVRFKKPDADTDYCYNYVKKGILRYKTGKYAQSDPPMGAMLGYMQSGKIFDLLNEINTVKITNQKKNNYPDLEFIELIQGCGNNGVSYLSQKIKRKNINFILHHLWGDFR